MVNGAAWGTGDGHLLENVPTPQPLCLMHVHMHPGCRSKQEPLKPQRGNLYSMNFNHFENG